MNLFDKFKGTRSMFAIGVTKEDIEHTTGTILQQPYVLIPYETNKFSHSSLIVTYDDKGEVDTFISLACNNFDPKDERYFCGGDKLPHEVMTWEKRTVISPLEENHNEETLVGYHFLGKCYDIEASEKQSLNEKYYEKTALLKEVIPFEIIGRESSFLSDATGQDAFKAMTNQILNAYDETVKDMRDIVDNPDVLVASALNNEDFLNKIDMAKSFFEIEYNRFRELELTEMINEETDLKKIERLSIERQEVMTINEFNNYYIQMDEVLGVRLAVDEPLSSYESIRNKIIDELSLSITDDRNEEGQMNLSPEELEKYTLNCAKLEFVNNLIQTHPENQIEPKLSDLDQPENRPMKINEEIIEKGNILFGPEFEASATNYLTCKTLKKEIDKQYDLINEKVDACLKEFVSLEGTGATEDIENAKQALEKSFEDLRVIDEKKRLLDTHFYNQYYENGDYSKKLDQVGEALFGKDDYGNNHFDEFKNYYQACYEHYKMLALEKESALTVINNIKDEEFKFNRGKSDLTPEEMNAKKEELNELNGLVKNIEAKQDFIQQYVYTNENEQVHVIEKAIIEADMTNLKKLDKDERNVLLSHQYNQNQLEYLESLSGQSARFVIEKNLEYGNDGLPKVITSVSLKVNEAEKLTESEQALLNTYNEKYHKIINGHFNEVYAEDAVNAVIKTQAATDILEKQGDLIDKENLKQTIESISKAIPLEQDQEAKEQLELKAKMLETINDYKSFIESKDEEAIKSFAARIEHLPEQVKEAGAKNQLEELKIITEASIKNNYEKLAELTAAIQTEVDKEKFLDLRNQITDRMVSIGESSHTLSAIQEYDASKADLKENIMSPPVYDYKDLINEKIKNIVIPENTTNIMNAINDANKQKQELQAYGQELNAVYTKELALAKTDIEMDDVERKYSMQFTSHDNKLAEIDSIIENLEIKKSAMTEIKTPEEIIEKVNETINEIKERVDQKSINELSDERLGLFKEQQVENTGLSFNPASEELDQAYKEAQMKKEKEESAEMDL